MTKPMEHDVSCGSFTIFFKYTRPYFTIRLSQNDKDYLNNSYKNDNSKNVLKFQSNRATCNTIFYMFSQGIICGAVQILFSHMWLEIY